MRLRANRQHARHHLELAYADIFFLGFGGSRWTSDMAINYYKTVLDVAVSLFAMVLLVGIGKTFWGDYYVRMTAGLSLKEMSVMMIVSIVLLMLVNKIPPMLSELSVAFDPAQVASQPPTACCTSDRFQAIACVTP